MTPTLLTGDNRTAAEALSAEVGTEKAIAEVLPRDEADVVKQLQAEGAARAAAGSVAGGSPEASTTRTTRTLPPNPRPWSSAARTAACRPVEHPTAGRPCPGGAVSTPRWTRRPRPRRRTPRSAPAHRTGRCRPGTRRW
nr:MULTISPECIES: hypothetical protein [Streptomyces]